MYIYIYIYIYTYIYIPFNLISLLNAYRYQKSAKQNVARGVSSINAASEMEFLVIIVFSFKPLTVFIENSALDVLGVLDPSLITLSLLLITSSKLFFCRLFKYKIVSLEDGCKIKTSQENLSLY